MVVQQQILKKGQITQEERVKIYGFIELRLSLREMWRRLNRRHTSISNEIERNSIDKWRWVFEYCPLEAERKRLERRKKANQQHVILFHDLKQRELLEKILEEKWESRWPDEMLWRMKNELKRSIISTPTFYRFIRLYKPSLQRFLRHKSYGYKPRWFVEKRGWVLDIPLLTERAESIDKRENEGDWEFDTIISNKKVRGGAVTWVDRKSRYLLIMKTPNLESDTVFWIMKFMLRNEKKHSITVDNWKEFAMLKNLWKLLKIQLFRCHSYASREKWTNEKHNWFLRRFLHKWCDINSYSDQEILDIQNKLNHKPRKILWYKTPYEVYHNITKQYLN